MEGRGVWSALRMGKRQLCRRYVPDDCDPHNFQREGEGSSECADAADALRETTLGAIRNSK